MEEEFIFTGYCRQLDQSRMVTIELEYGKLTECDCCYGGCIYEPSCTVAKQITEALTAASNTRQA